MQISWLLDKGVKMGKRKKSSHSRKGVSVRKFDGRKKRFGRGRESENKNEICADLIRSFRRHALATDL